MRYVPTTAWLVTALLAVREVCGAGVASVQGVAAHGHSVSITGTDFGIKPVAPPLVYDDLESGFSTNWADVNDLTLGTNDNRHAFSARNAFLNFRDGVDTGSVRARNTVYPVWYVQYWMLLGTNWDWGNSGYDETNRFLANLKIFRLWNPGPTDENVVFAIGAWAESVIFNVENVSGNTFDAYIGGIQSFFSKGTWHLLQFEFAENSAVLASDGVMRFWVDGTLRFNATNLVTREDTNVFKRPFIIGFDSVWAPNTALGESDDAPNDYTMDEIYMDTSWARVELLNSSTYGAATKREIQVPESWTDTGIVFRTRQGVFTNGEPAWLFVTTSNGTRSAGCPLIVGAEAGDADGDGATAWQEFVAGTDPTNSASVFRLAPAVTPAPDGFVVQWSSASNKAYTVSRATNLGSAFAPLASNIAATPPLNSYTDLPPAADTLFYGVDVR